MEQYTLFGSCEKHKNIKCNVDKEKRNWENGFQRWSNKQFEDGGTPLGKCGYGSMCDYCEDNSYGRPCVRALNEMLRVKRKTLDYRKCSYHEAWEGID